MGARLNRARVVPARRCAPLLLLLWPAAIGCFTRRDKEIDAYVEIDAVGCSGSLFGANAPVPGIDTSDQVFDPTQSDDPLEIWFTVENGTGFHVNSATRASVAEPFGAPVLASFARSNYDGDPSITRAGLHLLFTSDDGHVWQADRATRTGPWSLPAPCRASIRCMRTMGSRSATTG
jgi:hypothetical protein